MLIKTLQQSFGGYQEGVGTLRASGGDLGGAKQSSTKRNHPNDSCDSL